VGVPQILEPFGLDFVSRERARSMKFDIVAQIRFQPQLIVEFLLDGRLSGVIFG
jgi:hypothetical protein